MSFSMNLTNPHYLLTIGLAMSFFAGVAGEAGGREPGFPPPPNASLEWVSNAISWNGVDLGVRKFQSGDQIGDVADFYRKRWAKGIDGLPGYREAFASPWLILSKLDGDHLLAVQIQPAGNGGSWGYLSISDLPALARGDDPARVSPPSFPAMRGSQIVDDMSSRDPGKSGRVLSLTNAFSLDGNVTFYRDHYGASGWASQVDQAYGSGHTLVFAHDGRQVHIVVRRSDTGSAVVANEVEITR